jgi:hypothetical protein
MTRPNATSGVSQQNRVYRNVITITDRVAEAALNGADAAELTRVFAKMTRRTVVLLDPDLGLRASAVGDGEGPAEWNPDDLVMTRVLTALAAERRPIRVPALPGVGKLACGCVATPIAIGPTMLGFLLVFERPAVAAADDIDLLIASHAATLFALTLAHERTSTDLGLRFQAAVVDALVSGHFLDPADARRKALSIGLPSNVPFRVGVLRVSPNQPDSEAEPIVGQPEHAALDEVVGRFVASASGVIVAARGCDVVTIVPEPDGRADREAGPAANVLATLAECIRKAGIDDNPTAGLSERTAHPDLAPKALQQAEHAIELGLRLGRWGQVIAYDELGIYRLLLQIGDMQQLLEFAEDVLGPLIYYDATHRVDLVDTLSVYLSQHASLKRAARRLRVHANTVSYRMQRIEQLTPLDLTDPEDRLIAHVAVKIVESLRQAEAGSGSCDPDARTASKDPR